MRFSTHSLCRSPGPNAAPAAARVAIRENQTAELTEPHFGPTFWIDVTNNNAGVVTLGEMRTGRDGTYILAPDKLARPRE